MIEFTVTGKAASQGSVAYHPALNCDGKPLIRYGRPVLIPHHDSKILKPWRARVAANARLAMAGRPPLEGAIVLWVCVFRTRPKNHYNSKGELKKDAPEYPTTRPDTLKQVRAIEDACTGIVWLDDSQVVEHQLYKSYSPAAHVCISVTRKETSNGEETQEEFCFEATEDPR